MDQQATHLLTVLRDTNIPVDTKLDLIDKLKSHIKHHVVPENAVAPTFDVIRLSLTFSQLQDSAFSVLSHMTKRMSLQHQHDLLVYQGSKTYPIVLERLGDVRDRVQARAIQCLSEFWKVSPQEVEALVRDQALSSTKPRARKAAAQWVGRTHRDHNLAFKGFVPKLIQCASDADSTVSEVARSVLVELFRNAPEVAKADFQRQLSRSAVPSATADSMLTQVGHKTLSTAAKGSPASSRVLPERPAAAAPSTKSASSAAQSTTYSRDIGTTRGKKAGAVPPALDSAEAQPPPVNPSIKAELDPAKPIQVGSNGQFTLNRHLTTDNKDRVMRLEDLHRDFQPHFEGKESEQNWGARDKHITALRKLNKGNAPSDHHTAFLAQVKLFRDGILKVVNSLRTTPSTNACCLIQELARTFGSDIDPLVEWFMDNLIKLSGHTKAISAQNANQTISTLFNNVSYTKNLLLHISNASSDKNARPRNYAQGWLKAVIGRHINHKHILEHGNGVETLEKILRKGLTDPDPGVRDSARDAYWSFNPLWPNRGEA
jgi:CLIP-associating protein 1/2